jgi:signal transduction histidine kinase
VRADDIEAVRRLARIAAHVCAADVCLVRVYFPPYGVAFDRRGNEADREELRPDEIVCARVRIPGGNGEALGEIVVGATVPVELPPDTMATLEALASQARWLLPLRPEVRAIAGATRWPLKEWLDTMRDGLLVLDREFRVVAANRAALTLLRREAGALVGRSLPAEFPQSERFEEALRRAATTNRFVAFEVRYAPFDRYFEVRFYPAADRIVALFTDITDDHRAREALMRQEEIVRSTLEHLPDGVIVIEGDHVAEANPAACRLLGVAPPERPATLDELRRLLRARLVVEEGPADEQPIVRALRGEPVDHGRLLLGDQASAHQRTVALTATPLEGPAGVNEQIVITLRDITNESELGRLKDEFLSVAAHELMTPTAVMRSAAELLAHLAPQDGTVVGILRALERIASVAADLTDASQVALGRMRLHLAPTALDELIRRALEAMAAQPVGGRLRLGSCDVATVMADAPRLRRVVAHLVSNALKFSTKEVWVSLTVTADEAIVSVQDQGVGLPEEAREHVFERLHRPHRGTSDDRGGTGLGLYLANQIVTLHGGRMWFASQKRRGSCFSFSLPLHRAGSPR